ncbi:uncharacterized protein LOC125553804 [Triticum urartu]|uniref:uncharacterized protein LOC125553804 n=1 Tax=Triticum urartu TaxID=4572 RepID=UPI00204369B7|nr:uncharacterized protein LOC125553804 [Triticum urartu]
MGPPCLFLLPGSDRAMENSLLLAVVSGKGVIRGARVPPHPYAARSPPPVQLGRGSHAAQLCPSLLSPHPRRAVAEERSHGKGRCGRTGLHRQHLQFTPCEMSLEMLAMPFRACARAVQRAPSLPIGRWTMAVQLGDARHVVRDLCVCSQESAISISSLCGPSTMVVQLGDARRSVQGSCVCSLARAISSLVVCRPYHAVWGPWP